MASDEKLIEDLQEFAEELGHTPTSREMTEHGRWSSSTYKNHFGSWNNALEKANIEINKVNSAKNDDLLKHLHELAEELGHTPTSYEMEKHGALSARTYNTHFGSWNNALEKANIEINKVNSAKNDDLLKHLQELAEELGRSPKRREMSTSGDYSSKTYLNHFGSWNNALKKAGLEVVVEVNVNEEKLITELQELAEELGHTPTQRDMRSCGHFSDAIYKDNFGSWNNAVKKAGLEVVIETNVDEEKLIIELQEFADELGRTPTLEEMNKKGPRHGDTYKNRFGSWNNALREANLEIVRKSPEELAGEGKDPYGKGYSEARRKTFSRDNYNCRVCGSRSDLHCHHITPRKDFENISNSNTLDNLITMCPSCHTTCEGRWKEADPETFAENAQEYLNQKS